MGHVGVEGAGDGEVFVQMGGGGAAGDGVLAGVLKAEIVERSLLMQIKGIRWRWLRHS